MDLVGVGFELDWSKKKREKLSVKKKMETRGARMRELDKMIVELRRREFPTVLDLVPRISSN